MSEHIKKPVINPVPEKELNSTAANAARKESIMDNGHFSMPTLPLVTHGGHGDHNGHHGFSPSDAALVQSAGHSNAYQYLTGEVIREGQENIQATLESRAAIQRDLQESQCEITKAIFEQNDKTRDLLREQECNRIRAELSDAKQELSLLKANVSVSV